MLYKDFVKINFSKVKGTPQQKIRKIAKLWRKRGGLGEENELPDVGYKGKEETLINLGLDKYITRDIINKLKIIEEEEIKNEKKDVENYITSLKHKNVVNPSYSNLADKLNKLNFDIGFIEVKKIPNNMKKYNIALIDRDNKNYKKISIKENMETNEQISKKAKEIFKIPKSISTKILTYAKESR